MVENLSEHSTTTLSDEEILRGFFFHSRYISKNVWERYGFNPDAYTITPTSKNFFNLKEKLKELLIEKKKINVSTEKELRNLLGPDFDWVCIKKF